MPETEEEYRTKAAMVKCRPVEDGLVCIINEIRNHELKKSIFHVKKVWIDGCGGVDARFSSGELSLTILFRPEEIEEEFRKDPEYFAEHYALDVTIDKRNRVLNAFSVEPYPCE
jgi:hypothetical protein